MERFPVRVAEFAKNSGVIGTSTTRILREFGYSARSEAPAMRAANSVALDHDAVGFGAGPLRQANAAVHLFPLDADVEVGVARGDFGRFVEYDQIPRYVRRAVTPAVRDKFEGRDPGGTFGINGLRHDRNSV